MRGGDWESGLPSHPSSRPRSDRPTQSELSDLEQLSTWAAFIAREQNHQVRLVFNCRLSVYFNEDGSLSSRKEVSPHDKRPNYPYVQIGKNRLLFDMG